VRALRLCLTRSATSVANANFLVLGMTHLGLRGAGAGRWLIHVDKSSTDTGKQFGLVGL